ncbi:beta-L-arabinofuranosidase domain-containing protein [Paenibacillus sp. MMO-177]|uniref:beta-L-arabinofuranosidase domain-containing protein n=1 Tax=Paenibacillus sp. MMO-177 TaxID=3081289 RepID=UPI0030192DB1
MFISFELDEVRLTDDVFASRRELAKAYIREFDHERLMHTFKINAGISSAAEPLGGWEAPDCGLRGHFVGHFLSACAKFAYGDHDETLKTKASEIVGVLQACAQPSGYLSAFEEEKLDVLELEENRNVWAPYYTLHKIMQGLIDCYKYLHHAQALELAVNLAHYIRGRFERLSHWKIDGILRCTKVNPVNEFGGLGDSLYTLYELTGDAMLLGLARIFDRDYWLGPLAEGRDVLEDLHANTHLPMILAAMHRYKIGEEDSYKKSALRFYDFLKGRTFANGNNSSKATAFIRGGVSEKAEHWGGYGQLADALTGGESESCCAHNTEKIVERLLEWSPETGYLDHLESLKYNAVLNSASAKTGLSQYHQPLGTNAVKKFSEPYHSFWCCTGSGIEAMSELQKNIWFRNGNAILLNAFVSSQAAWKERGIVIHQRTSFPDSLISALHFEMDEPAELRMMFKEKAVKNIRINDEGIHLEKEEGYIVVERLFRNGDRIDIEIEASLRLIPLPGSEASAALLYGSVLLARVGDDKPLTGISDQNLEEKLAGRVKDGKLEVIVEDDRGTQARFIPLFRVEEESYSVYIDWSGLAAPERGFSFAADGRAAYGGS